MPINRIVNRVDSTIDKKKLNCSGNGDTSPKELSTKKCEDLIYRNNLRNFMRLIESSFAPDNRWTIILIDNQRKTRLYSIICTHFRNIFKKEQRQKVAHWKNLPTITDLVSFFILFPIFLRHSCYSPSILFTLSLLLPFSLSLSRARSCSCSLQPINANRDLRIVQQYVPVHYSAEERMDSSL